MARAQRSYRDTRNGKIMGVCVGIADYFGWNVTFIRILAVIALVWFNAFTLIVYLAPGFLLPVKPVKLYDWDEDKAYWRSIRPSAGGTFRDACQRFRELDRKLQRMEGYIASNRYDLDRQFRILERSQS